MTTERTKLLLAACAAVLLPVLWHNLAPVALDSGEGVRPPAVAPGRTVEPVRTVEELRPAVRTPASALMPGLAPGRDPWRFVEAAVRRADRSDRSDRSDGSVRSGISGIAEARSTQPAAVPTAAPPAFPWRYLGSFGPADRRIAVFAEPAGTVHNVREGETLAGGFILDKIGFESADVRPVRPAAAVQRLRPGRAER